jgi:hypothetical protein
LTLEQIIVYSFFSCKSINSVLPRIQVYIVLCDLYTLSSPACYCVSGIGTLRLTASLVNNTKSNDMFA